MATVATGGGPLTTRGGPSTVDGARGSLTEGARVTVVCQVYGQRVAGTRGRSPYWNRLADGRYVADAYLRWRPARPTVPWCGATGGPATATVTGTSAAVRRGPGTDRARVGTVARGAGLAVRCQMWGERVTGPGGASNAWNRLGAGRYVSDALVTWRPSRPTLPWCGQAPPTVPAATAEEFIARMAGPARQSMRKYRVPASVTIAQAILESGWGRSGLARRDHNFFGIKCFGTPGAHALGCRSYATSECGRGKCWRTTATFRAYRDAAGSLADHGHFLVVNPRYRPAFKHTGDANRFAREIHKAGYATSPTYATNLIGIMKRYDLYRFDRR
ncbi:MAG TPA: sporangiospore maturation cell wall hydrolase GsmA [Pilimelia sp.]|nr:sporangiospore maturation cell wall hydrolase GsmA [Pilimelia sp.]